MKCAACGYIDEKDTKKFRPSKVDGQFPFIEVFGLEVGPLHEIGDLERTPRLKGAPVHAFACPSCGTVRIEK